MRRAHGAALPAGSAIASGSLTSAVRTKRMRFWTAVTLGPFALASALGGCGGGSSAEPLSQRSIATQVRQLHEQLVSREDLRRARPGSVEHAFLSYWRSVQFADVERAEEAYEPGLRASIGRELLALAIRNSSPTYRVQTPVLDEVRTTGDHAVVRYIATPRVSGVTATPASMSWTRTTAGWRIRHSSALDAELREAAQSREQVRVTSSQALDPRAVRAGELAAGLQAKYLERVGPAR